MEENARGLFAGGFGRAILSGIKKAYQVRSDGHRLDDGDNSMTFGMNVRFSIEKFVEESFPRGGDVAISRPLGSFQLAYRGNLYHFTNLG